EVAKYGSPFIMVNSSIWKSTIFSSSSNILNTNPQFTNIYTFNFTLKQTSPAINLCSPAGVSDDIIGTLRGLQPDAGAYEFK
ncbi:MAG: hypothetical protein H7259_06195, partial [Cytophagales bacterium]|nr:hypothetical protein [Cytophaga sp.]